MTERDPERSDSGLLVQDLTYAGLDAMRAAVPLDLCAYLHAAQGQGPQLYLGAPSLATIEPSDAFNLFTALRDALETEHEGDPIALPGYEGIAVSSTGPSSRGLHVAARRGAALLPDEREALLGLARTFGRLAHALEAVGGGGERPVRPQPVRVAVEMIDGTAHAEVGVSSGDELRTGVGEAPSAARAVALAAVDAVDAGLKTIDAAEGEIADARAVLVLLADPFGRHEVGARLIDDETDSLRATAIAALEAATRLRDASAGD